MRECQNVSFPILSCETNYYSKLFLCHMLVHVPAGMQQISSQAQETQCQCSVSWKNSDPTELLNWRTRKEVCAVIQILWAQNIEHLNVHRQIVGAYMQIKHVCRWHR